MVKNAFGNIKKVCEKGLKKRYKGGIPKEAEKRLDIELECLKNSDYLEDFELQLRLFDEAKESKNLILTRGTITGSFIFYLIGNSKLNPLPAHYYCPKCGYYKEMGRGVYGIDLPEKKCPTCGEMMISDGVDIPVLEIWSKNSSVSFESNVSSGFYSYAKKLLEKMYPDNCIEISGIQLVDKPNNEFVQGGFFILPKGKTIDDYPEFATYLDDGKRCMMASLVESKENGLKKINMIPSEALDCATYMQNKTGLNYDDIKLNDIGSITYKNISDTRMLDKQSVELLEKSKPSSFRMICNLNATSYNTYDLKEYDDLYTFINSDLFKNCPLYVREDVYDNLVEQGMDQNTASDYTKMVRMGQVYRYVNSSNGDIIKKYKNLINLDVSDELYKTSSKCMYLFPRAHSVSYMLLYATLAFYMKKDSKSYDYFLK